MTPKQIMEEWKRYLWQDCDGNYSQAICGWHDQLIELGIVNELTEAENKKFWAEVSVEEEKSDRRRFLRPIL